MDIGQRPRQHSAAIGIDPGPAGMRAVATALPKRAARERAGQLGTGHLTDPAHAGALAGASRARGGQGARPARVRKSAACRAVLEHMRRSGAAAAAASGSARPLWYLRQEVLIVLAVAFLV